MAHLPGMGWCVVRFVFLEVVGKWIGVHKDGFLTAQHSDYRSQAGSNLRLSQLHPFRRIHSDQSQLRKNRHTNLVSPLDIFPGYTLSNVELLRN